MADRARGRARRRHRRRLRLRRVRGRARRRRARARPSPAHTARKCAARQVLPRSAAAAAVEHRRRARVSRGGCTYPAHKRALRAYAGGARVCAGYLSHAEHEGGAEQEASDEREVVGGRRRRRRDDRRDLRRTRTRVWLSHTRTARARTRTTLRTPAQTRARARSHTVTRSGRHARAYARRGESTSQSLLSAAKRSGRSGPAQSRPPQRRCLPQPQPAPGRGRRAAGRAVTAETYPVKAAARGRLVGAPRPQRVRRKDACCKVLRRRLDPFRRRRHQRPGASCTESATNWTRLGLPTGPQIGYPRIWITGRERAPGFGGHVCSAGTVPMRASARACAPHPAPSLSFGAFAGTLPIRAEGSARRSTLP